MNYRDWLRVPSIEKKQLLLPKRKSDQDLRFPLHECIDRPSLPCPACLKAAAEKKRKRRRKKT
jgi:hypothetical protein